MRVGAQTCASALRVLVTVPSPRLRGEGCPEVLAQRMGEGDDPCATSPRMAPLTHPAIDPGPPAGVFFFHRAVSIDADLDALGGISAVLPKNLRPVVMNSQNCVWEFSYGSPPCHHHAALQQLSQSQSGSLRSLFRSFSPSPGARSGESRSGRSGLKIEVRTSSLGLSADESFLLFSQTPK